MLSPNDFFVMCGRNTIAAGQVSAMANGVPITVAAGGEGNVQMVIGVEPSDWQLSRVYVWDYHLPDDMFFGVSDALISYLAGTPCQCPPGHSCTDSGDAALPKTTLRVNCPLLGLNPPYMVRRSCCR
jgi:hypothetical protein